MMSRTLWNDVSCHDQRSDSSEEAEGMYRMLLIASHVHAPPVTRE
jgi:hypothetical protein